MRKLFALCLTATLTGLGLGATTTTAQAAPQAIAITEVLINTAPNALTAQLDGVEIAKPSGTTLNNYKIQTCDSAGNLSTVATLDTRSDNLGWTAASNKANAYDYTFAPGAAALDRQGGVRLIDSNNNVVYAVAFTNSATVATCLNAVPDQAPAPTDILSAQRICDTGHWVLAPPTFGGPNFCL